MAKKSQTPTPTPAANSSSSAITLTEAIRDALKDLGPDAVKKDVEGWIKAFHPSLAYKESTLNSTLSNIKKKLRDNSSVSSGAQITTNDLMKVKGMAEEQGGVEELLALIAKVETLAARAGGVPRLKQSLDALKKIKA